MYTCEHTVHSCSETRTRTLYQTYCSRRMYNQLCALFSYLPFIFVLHEVKMDMMSLIGQPYHREIETTVYVNCVRIMQHVLHIFHVRSHNNS